MASLNSNQYSDEKLLSFIEDNATDNVEDTGMKIIDEIEKFAEGTEQFDDITLLLIHYY